MRVLKETCLDYLKRMAEKSPQKPLFGDETGWLDAREVLEEVIGLARGIGSLGLQPGDAVKLAAARCRDTAIMILALRALGMLVILADPREEISEGCEECETRLPVSAVIFPDPQERFCMIKGGCQIRLSTDANVPDMDFPQVSPSDPAFVIFTSGTTGKKKAVVLCENNLISDLIYTRPLGDYRMDDLALGVLPLTHVFGLVLLIGTLVLDYSLYFPEKTDIPYILSCVAKEGITRMNGVPSLYLAMTERAEEYDISSLRTGFIGGGPVSEDQFIRIEQKLGMTLIPAYGMTESVGITCAASTDPLHERASGAGRIYPVNSVLILDEKGKEAAAGQVGEILVKGPMRMLGYYDKPLPEDAFFPTGDLGCLDEKGFLHLTGRKKELIIRNGNNISPVRIEEALMRLSGVHAAAVIGLPDERQGEVPYAMIVGEADPNSLRELLHKNELPAGILSVDALPMTASGKPDKTKIAEVLRLWKNG